MLYMTTGACTESKLNKIIELMTFAVTWSANIFVGCSVTPTFFQQITSFSDSFNYTKKQKNLYVGSFHYFSYIIHWYMDTGVSNLVACFKANSTWINDIGSKDLSNRPIYAVLNTHNLDMTLQLKYMPIVMNPARIASSDWKS